METAEIFRALVDEMIKTMDNAHGRIRHCVDQLSDEDIWAQPSDDVNSVGIILQHLCGNLRQWIVSGVGGELDVRDRPSEFRAPRDVRKAQLVADLDAVIERCRRVMLQLSSDEILQPRRIQGFDETVLSAMFSSVPHLELHAGQIVYITRLLLGDRYQLRWKPATAEQGAE